MAKSPSELKIAEWTKTLDAMKHGAASFAIEDIPWGKDDYSTEKSFLLSVIDMIIARSGEEQLSYTPGWDVVIPKVEMLRHMIDGFCLKDN